MPTAVFDPIRYWGNGSSDQNAGDYFSELLVDRLLVAPKLSAACYHLIGSTISENQIRADLRAAGDWSAKIAFWGCGLREATSLDASVAARALFCGARGPLTRHILGLPVDTPLGDPGLLAPLLHAPSARKGGGVLCVLHVHDPRTEADVLAETGADRVMRARIAPSIPALTEFLDAIAAADFVLAGALHAAVFASAYRTPFAFYDSGYVNLPFKWRDFAGAIGIGHGFVRSEVEGKAQWRDETSMRLSLPPLAPLLRVSPFVVRSDIELRALVADGALTAAEAAPAIDALKIAGVSATDWRADAVGRHAAERATRWRTARALRLRTQAENG